jgi:hypothetical protein
MGLILLYFSVLLIFYVNSEKSVIFVGSKCMNMRTGLN